MMFTYLGAKLFLLKLYLKRKPLVSIALIKKYVVEVLQDSIMVRK